MKEFKFIKPMATEMHITVSQRGEPIEVITPNMDGYTVLAEWRIEIMVGGVPLLYKQIMMPSTAHEHDLMVMIDTIIGIEFTEGMCPVAKFETNEEGDY